MARPAKQNASGVIQGKSYWVYSTLANDNRYVEWINGGGELSYEGRSVLIRGGAGVMNDRIITPMGIATEVSEDDMSVLNKCPVFKVHKDNGYILIQEKYSEVEAVVTDMTGRDKSAPITPSDFQDAHESVAVPMEDYR
jgi:hypothetical protein